MSTRYVSLEIMRLGDARARVCEGPDSQSFYETWLRLACDAEVRTPGGLSRLARDSRGRAASRPGALRALRWACQESLEGMLWTAGLGSADQTMPMGLVAWMAHAVSPSSAFTWASTDRICPVLRVAGGPQVASCLTRERAWELRQALLRLASVPDAPLRPYQADLAWSAFSAPFGRGILSASCGAGKTWVAAAILAVGRRVLGGRWLYIAPNAELARQTARVLHRALPRLQLAAGTGADAEAGTGIGDCGCGWDWLHCVSYGGIGDEPPGGWTGVLIDECHTLGGEQRMAWVTRGIQRAQMVIGLSATPAGRQDGRNMSVVALTGPVLRTPAQASMPALVDAGFLSGGCIVDVERDSGSGFAETGA